MNHLVQHKPFAISHKQNDPDDNRFHDLLVRKLRHAKLTNQHKPPVSSETIVMLVFSLLAIVTLYMIYMFFHRGIN